MTALTLVMLAVAVTVTVLKVVAPLTKTKLDDEALALLEKVQPHVTPEELAKLRGLFK